MARGGSAKLTEAQRTRRKERALGLAGDLSQARDEYLASAKSIAQKHHRSMGWVSNMLYISGKKGATRRAANAWSTFQGRRIRQLNRDRPEGDRYKVGTVPEEEMEAMREEYGALTAEERAELKEESTQAREEKENAVKLSNKAVEKDFEVTMKSINIQLESLMNRTGCEVMLVGVRGNAANYQQPHVFVSDRAKSWLKHAYNVEPDDVGLQLEGFAVSNAGKSAPLPAKQAHHNDVAECRNTIQAGLDAILFKKLNKPLGCVLMNYANYERKIVEEYGVELQGWPLPKGPLKQNPGDLKRADVLALRGALRAGHCKWASLSSVELEARKAQNAQKQASGDLVYFEAKVRRKKGSTNPTSTSSPDNSPGASETPAGSPSSPSTAT
ncbi:hypothetical protein BV25DRAFT_1918197 [Artomyces pyxidatus]|uniref:Uncharacterized protein n=1 Tax=Artomyces pyxidatus TaxID=48021 RepID=A0ACB8SVU5_9AGAM|nr:hypothetical protein BV25DRAFT_1918197 [Artomyces pyxidatus]